MRYYSTHNLVARAYLDPFDRTQIVRTHLPMNFVSYR
uniref:Uncharacterized protein n=1 Tax=Anopheles dirus TaxID=7168 RepID=A0A182NYC1_9DIPT